jgi:UDP-N-acetylmuramate dehydrogenase
MAELKRISPCTWRKIAVSMNSKSLLYANAKLRKEVMGKLEALVQNLDLKGKVCFNKSLAPYARLGVGGECSVFYIPADLLELKYFLQHIPASVPVTVLGNGSNVLIRDKGIDGVVIKLGQTFSFIKEEDVAFVAGAATLNSVLCQVCLANEISNFAFASCIPGSVGGGVVMNAGSYGTEFADLLLELEALDRLGNVHKVLRNEINFDYRKSNLPPDWIVLSAKFIKEKAPKHSIRSLMEEYQARRLKTQPIYAKTAGSTFKNPSDKSAWQHIDAVGGRSMRIGGASWSSKHLNFIINDGSATAYDLESLMGETQNRVYLNSGITMELEVRILGCR